jgi:mRNA interferase RelE/StbE
LSEFTIAESKTFEKVKKKVEPKLYQKIKNIVYPQLRKNPHFGTNIKKLKGEFAEYYRFRIGNYRLFYLVDNTNSLIIIVELRHRQSAYR